MSALVNAQKPLIKAAAAQKAKARRLLFARRVHFTAAAASLQAEGACLPAKQARLDAATCLPARQANLKELRYHG